MSKLFIIGNGFDLAHDLPTSYNDFRDYLLKTYDISKASMDESFYYEVPTPSMGPKGGPLFNHSDNVKFLVSILSTGIRAVNHQKCLLIDEKEEQLEWRWFESALGRLPFQDCFEYTDGYIRDEGEDIPHYGRTIENKEQRSNEIGIVVSEIGSYFRNWIAGINRIIPNSAQPKAIFIELFEGENTLFLTFNYTDTLESIYDIPEEHICHIHGQVSKPDREIIFGHGDVPNETKTLVEEEYSEDIIGDCCERLTNQLSKDTEKCLVEQSHFFINMKESENQVSEIYSNGFSFSDVDMPYMKKICEILPTESIAWYMNNRDSDEDRERYRQKLRNAGFKGRFEEYNVV